MYFRTPIYVGLAGTSLIVSQVPFHVKFESSKNEQVNPRSFPQDTFFQVQDDINSYAPEEPNDDISPTIPSTDYSEKTFFDAAGGVYLLSNALNKKFYLHKTHKPLNDFSLGFFATEEDYAGIKKSDIKIELFKNSAWNNDSFNDEYEAMEENKILDIFEGIDETKTKQLLLSLSIRREWKKLSQNSFSIKVWSDNDLIDPESIDDLKKLKIKYFKDSDSLKEYVQKKVKSCKGEKKACVASEKELSILEQDKSSFFQKNN